MLYIDAFNHILPKKYQAVLEQKVPNRDMSSNLSRYAETVPTLLDLDARFRLMDSVEGYMQVLTLAAPTVESVASPEVAVDLCRFANDEMAELVEKYPDRFAAAIAALPLNDLDASLEEIDRAIRDLRLRGIQMYSDVNGMPLDAESLYPIYEKMERYNLPILIHPRRSPALPDYPGEENSRYRAWTKLGWPVASSMALTPSFIWSLMNFRRVSIMSSSSLKVESCGTRETWYFHFLPVMPWIISSVLGPSSQLKPQLQIRSGAAMVPVT